MVVGWICLEDNTERSESNPGRSLGTINHKKRNCLEDSTLKTGIDEGISFKPILHSGTVFQTAVFIIFTYPETLSRVTLASFGIVFQTNPAEKPRR